MRFVFFSSIVLLGFLISIGCESENVPHIPKPSTTIVLTKSGEMMNENTFWKLIDQSLKATSNQDEQAAYLTQELEKCSPKQIIGFRLRTDKLLYDTYTSNMCCAGYLLNGGCSDDSFEYFRCWVISRGKETYYAAKKNPDSLVKEYNPENEFYDFEDFWYVANDAFENVSGKDLYDYIDETVFKTHETNYVMFDFTWEEDDPESMRKICPMIFKKVDW
jgi:Protein of unknown function (DUF4240)